IDRQVKIRGQRVEPGEIESTIRRLPGVAGAAVLVVASGLVAFVDGEGSVAPARVLAELRATLPSAWVPASVVLVEHLPRLASGKPNASALRALAAASDAG